MAQSLRTSQWVPFPVELVFAFFANPANLPHLMPKWQQARIEDSKLIPPPPRPLASEPTLRFQSPAAGTGSEMSISFRPIAGIGFRIGWLARITDFVWNDHFSDTQVSGPFALWNHTHHIVSEMRDGISGTIVADELEYALPLGIVGSITNTVVIRRQMESTFSYRQKRLEEILPVAARQAARRS